MSSKLEVHLTKNDFHEVIKARVIAIDNNTHLTNYMESNKPSLVFNKVTITAEAPIYPNDQGYTRYIFNKDDLPLSQLQTSENIKIGDIILITRSINIVIATNEGKSY